MFIGTYKTIQKNTHTSEATIRNEKYKRENLKGIYKHNERKKTKTILIKI